MFRKTLISLLFLIYAPFSYAADGVTGIETYQIDKDHTNIMWYISHMGFSRTIGNFKEFEGTVDLNHDDPDKSKIYITIDTASISSGVEDLDRQLRSELFFDVEEYPTAIFESTDITLIEENSADVKGNFTMLGKTKEITLNVRFNKRAMDPILNRMRTGYSIKSSMKRSQWGMDQMLAFVSDEINITIEAEALKIDQ
ncbi:MAG: YceI family protein [Kordiimonadaceae bacterium]|jgi:polyisoprenoid-binding protein YceI|nr:YceI family protein [Kordiimonadaceae bacterium]MBT6036198.1 YceI family protein [Kordiimonadaceae bacterium]MBT6329240.1 YceI family protein [Kordiimonadaceae bacterium]MBT7582728.1 YceI family protein [Kordiimonadaceae bacterium]